MSRKEGDKAYATYVHYQAFSSDMPIHRIDIKMLNLVMILIYTAYYMIL